MSLTTLPLAKEMLGISHSQQDNVIQKMLDGAEQFVSGFCGIRFNATAADAKVEEDIDGGMTSLHLNHRPVLSVVSVTNRTSGSVIDSGFYRYDERTIWFASGGRWGEGKKEWTVAYTAGYTAATLPDGVEEAVLQLVHRAYNNRGSLTSMMGAGMSTAWGKLLDGEIIDRLRPFSFRRTIS